MSAVPRGHSFGGIDTLVRSCECTRNCRCLCHYRTKDGQSMAKHCVPCCGVGSAKHSLCKDNKRAESIYNSGNVANSDNPGE